MDIDAHVRRLLARGPEFQQILDLQQVPVILGFTRLAINGLTPEGHQPFLHDDIAVVCNGEIYNYKELAARYNIPLSPNSSDCQILPHLLRILTPTQLCRALDGVFALVAVDMREKTVLVARDPYGVRPLFQGNTAEGSRVWASEVKGLTPACTDVERFSPGTWAKYDMKGILLDSQEYHNYTTTKLGYFQGPENRIHAQKALRESLLWAVRKRLLSDRPIGALLSGGVDSSLVAAIAARELAKHDKKLHTFSIGMPGSTDLKFAQEVANHIGSEHHNVLVTPDDFLAAIPQVIHDAETYDITSVRASVGNWLIGKYIKEHTDIKVVFNGDGSDEIGGGYLYFFNAPNDDAFEEECLRLLKEIHIYDVLRSDRSMAAHGLEARTPFLDKNVAATWLSLDTSFRRPIKGVQMEKQILREAFEHDNYLPPSVLWRRKEAFSDGVSSKEDSWYKRCGEYAKAAGITMNYIHMMTALWHNPPQTEEAFHYRRMFEEHYGAHAANLIPHMWMPRWVAGAYDPSARTLTALYE